MTVTAKLYIPAFLSAFNKELDFDSDDMRAMLVGTGYTPDQDTHRYLSSVVANEVSGTNYSAGGVALTTKSITIDGATNTVKFDADDVTFSNVTLSPGPRFVVIYDRTPSTDATRPLLSYADLGAAVPVTAGDLVIRFNASGIDVLTIS